MRIRIQIEMENDVPVNVDSAYILALLQKSLEGCTMSSLHGLSFEWELDPPETEE